MALVLSCHHLPPPPILLPPLSYHSSLPSHHSSLPAPPSPSLPFPPPLPCPCPQVIGILSIAGWVLGTMGPFFLLFRAAGSLRISAEDEHKGLDASKHGVRGGGGGGEEG